MEQFNAFFFIGGPLLALVAGYWIATLLRKKEDEEVIEELLRLREYNLELSRKLNKEKEIILGIKNFLQDE